MKEGIKGPDKGFDRFDRQAETITGISDPQTREERVALAGIAEALAEVDGEEDSADFGKFADHVRVDD